MTTAMDSTNSSPANAARSERLSRRWLELCALYLPVAPAGSMWRYSRANRRGEPEQGWKLHVSATVLNAPRVLARIAPLLSELGVSFKAPASLQEVRRLNSGLHYAYSQVGKIITVYPCTDEEAVELARRLHELTRRTHAPAVPFDLHYRHGSNVYYRYGAFGSCEMESPTGGHVPAIRDRRGELTPDVRTSERAKPEWVEDPFIKGRPTRAKPTPASQLGTTLRVFRALSQRGKGGVYQALDLSAESPRLCLLKEGRRWGEMSWDGCDGYRRVMHEEHVLGQLRARGVDVPRVYSSFEMDGNYYCLTEFIDGETLQSYLFRRQRRLPVARVLRHAVQLARFIAQIHDAGWVWRDCKPANLIVTSREELRPLDFEGACPLGSHDPSPWMTPAFTPPRESARDKTRPCVYDDLYALSAITYLLLTGRMPEGSPAMTPIRKLRRDAPLEVCALVEGLLHSCAQTPPDASEVARRLQDSLARISPSAASDPRIVAYNGGGSFMTAAAV
jgi:hypothetical protein